jgi:hypothetical protein
MCISASSAIFSKTITGTWEVSVDSKIKHVIWYQNRVGETEKQTPESFEKSVEQWIYLQGDWFKGNTTGLRFSQLAVQEAKWRMAGGAPRRLTDLVDEQGGNCLIIPLMGSWESIYLLNTADTPSILSDIATALRRPDDQPLSLGPDTSRGGAHDRMVFLQFDVYDIVIAERASRIADVIGQIQTEKRPNVDSKVFAVLEDWYRCPVALCCFKKSEAAEAKPISFAFEPTNPDRLVVYTLDGHDGGPPDPSARVKLDHTIFVGSHCTPIKHATPIKYADKIPDHLRPYVLDHAMGLPLSLELINGDIVFDTAAVREGYFKGERLMPPFAPVRSDNGEPILLHQGLRKREEKSLQEPKKMQEQQKTQKKWYQGWF